ncbi:MAG: GntR family transcriptional regulator [Flavobacteriales bacterium]|nr:GntR family transcriptional regulator [Flavobacteriales bacterium]MBO72279.1 GntR family transcriptional regulator [Flavobacteriales bacterium]|tara:strand:+ start:361 stop:1200 length:840 start_codon:yes stop_codon:yes gene_type:complete
MNNLDIGRINTLTAARQEPQGFYLRGEDPFDQVLLPNAYVPKDFKVGDEIDVFVYLDNEERITATTLVPHIHLNDFAALTVAQVNRMGAFLDMGIVKQLLVPYKEQAIPMEEGKSYVVYMYLDEKTKRLVGTSKFNRYLNIDECNLEKGEEVDLMILHSSSLGTNVIINKKHRGLIFKSDVNQPLKLGQKIKGFVKVIRDDGKIDVILQKEGVASFEPNAEKVLEILRRSDGFLGLHDKSDPQEISKRLLMSKKSFKRAIGNLYRDQKIKIEKDGIRLV